MIRRALLAPFLLSAALLWPLRAAAAAPTHTPTPNVPATVQAAVADTQTALAAQTTPSPSPTPTPVLVTGPGGDVGNPCQAGDYAVAVPLPFITGTLCLPISGLLTFIGTTLMSMFTDSLRVVTGPFVGILTHSPDVTGWADVGPFWAFLWQVGVGIFGAFLALAGLHWLRRTAYVGDIWAPLLGLSDAVVGGLLLGALGFLLSQAIGTTNWLSGQINGYLGTLGLTGFDRLLGDLTAALTGDPLLLPLDLLIGLLTLVVALCVALIRAVGIYAELWLYLIAPLAMACWVYPPTRDIARRWMANFASILLWAPGWAVALKVVVIVNLDLPLSDPAWNTALLRAVNALAGMVFLFAVPRLIDALVGAVVAAASGSYVMALGMAEAVGSAAAGAKSVLGATKGGKRP